MKQHSGLERRRFLAVDPAFLLPLRAVGAVTERAREARRKERGRSSGGPTDALTLADTGTASAVGLASFNSFDYFFDVEGILLDN